MVDFSERSERIIPIDNIPSFKLQALVAYWTKKKGDLPYLKRSAFDPMEIADLLGQIRIVEIEPDQVFRFRLYGSNATNPDRFDMTGKTTRDYQDKNFAELVTRHYSIVAEDGQPRCWHINATVSQGTYEYFRVVLPFSYCGTEMDALLVSSDRIRNDSLLWR